MTEHTAATLRELVEEWLADVAEADEDQPGALDFYVRVGARWSNGSYEKRMREALAGSSEPLPTGPDPDLRRPPDPAPASIRLALWLIYHIPTGAGWRFSRFRLLRRLGDWWLPRWYSLGTELEARCGR